MAFPFTLVTGLNPESKGKIFLDKMFLIKLEDSVYFHTIKAYAQCTHIPHY